MDFLSRRLIWVFATLAGVFGLLLSVLIAPTLFECKLFTECHEINVGYALVSIFSADANSTLANEKVALQTAHSIAMTLAFALFGLAGGAIVQRARRATQDPSSWTSPLPLASVRSQSLELNGTGAFLEYYLKIDSDELAAMPQGFTVGRDSDNCEFPISDDTISRAHARLHARGGKFSVEDIGSRNGTKLNGRALAQREIMELRSGDHLTFGSVTFGVFLA